MSEATPRPWVIEHGGGGGDEQPVILSPQPQGDQAGVEVAGCCPMTEADAALIVRAVNAHEGLVAALEACIEDMDNVERVIAQARAALGAAKAP